MSDYRALLEDLSIRSTMIVKVMASPGKPVTKLKRVVEVELQNNRVWILYIDVAATPARGDANKELCIFLAKLFSHCLITLKSGHTSKEKYFLISTLDS